MGYIRHHAIVIVSANNRMIELAHETAVEYKCTVTPIVDSTVNGYRSFLVCPDGSKEGWLESEAGNEQRELLIKWMNSKRYDDGSSSLSWVEVEFGGDDAHQINVTNYYGNICADVPTNTET